MSEVVLKLRLKFEASAWSTTDAPAAGVALGLRTLPVTVPTPLRVRFCVTCCPCVASLVSAKNCAAIEIDACAADRSLGAIPDRTNYPARSIQGEIDVDGLIL